MDNRLLDRVTMSFARTLDRRGMLSVIVGGLSSIARVPIAATASSEAERRKKRNTKQDRREKRANNFQQRQADEQQRQLEEQERRRIQALEATALTNLNLCLNRTTTPYTTCDLVYRACCYEFVFRDNGLVREAWSGNAHFCQCLNANPNDCGACG